MAEAAQSLSDIEMIVLMTIRKIVQCSKELERWDAADTVRSMNRSKKMRIALEYTSTVPETADHNKDDPLAGAMSTLRFPSRSGLSFGKSTQPKAVLNHDRPLRIARFFKVLSIVYHYLQANLYVTKR